jgi:ribonuclease HII
VTVTLAQMTLQEIRQRLLSFDDQTARQLQTDPRRGAQHLYRTFQAKKRARTRAERRRQEMLVEEMRLRRRGARAIAGLDEAGRGPLAGPVVAAAAMLPWPCRWLGMDDSKRLTADQRERWAGIIRCEAVAVGVGIVPAARIDAVGILAATWEAMSQALADLKVRPDHLLVDGPLRVPAVDIPQTALIDGDARSLSVAAASVVAKVTRDRMMKELHERYPQYGFARHKGYGTREHLAALQRHGPCRIHRESFRGVLSAER